MADSGDYHHPGTPRVQIDTGSDAHNTDVTNSPVADGRLPTSRSLTAGRAGHLRSPSSQGPLHGSMSPSDPSELLLPPSRSRPRRFRDEADSRRTSWSSESGSSRDSRSPFYSPFEDSRAPSRAGSDDEHSALNTQTVSEKYNILPSAGLLLYPEDVEKDDYLHNPDPNDKDGVACADLFSKRSLVNLGGLIFLGVGLLVLFIGYPVITFVESETDNPVEDSCASNPLCINTDQALLSNLKQALIDPATPESAYTKTGADGSTLTLVYSDEFEDDGRTFYPGDDSYWNAVNLWYGVTEDLEWYDPDAITTEDGVLTIQFDHYTNHGLNYRSGMLQSWNQMCFKTGLLEAAISLPGAGNVSGFWPGFWALGNLARPGYAATTDGTWPYSYDNVCDAGITPNQSDPDGYNQLPGMRLPACTCDGEDHPNPGTSRCAPEIDVLEASVDITTGTLGSFGTASQSLQVAPFDRFWRPDTAYQEIYDYSVTGMNSYQGGLYQQALSGVTNLNNDWYDGNAYQTYSFEYSTGTDGWVSWAVGDVPTWKVTAQSLRPNGNIAARIIPEEPMALVINYGMSEGFAYLETDALIALMPAKMRIDYVRIYQDSDGVVTCDPEGYETTSYIADHPVAYNDWNHTTWESAGYTKPLNSLMNGCNSSAESEASIKRMAAWDCDDLVCSG